MISLEDAAAQIRSGKVVAFPTETVYGLGANAENDAACQEIYRLKNRPSKNPLIVHVANYESAQNLGEFNPVAERLAKAFWPGPLTIVVKCCSNLIAPTVTSGLDTIALRVPANNIAQELIRLSGKPLAAPSANISGYISPTTTEHVSSAFPGISILEGADSIYGLESTIIAVSSNKPQLLRYGFITPELITELIGKEVEFYHGQEIIAPGMAFKHYAPNNRLRLNATELAENEIGLAFGSVLAAHAELNLSMTGNLAEAAGNLYKMLRILDIKASQSGKSLAVAPIPNCGIGLAIVDRLARAAAS